MAKQLLTRNERNIDFRVKQSCYKREREKLSTSSSYVSISQFWRQLLQ